MIFAQQIENAYRAKMFSRQEVSHAVSYFSAKDFDSLHKDPYLFNATAGHRLQGYFYYYDNPNKDRIVIFDHGMGAGHRAYMREIAMLARHGYLVFAYDHTGCVESEGESTNGFAQSLSDLDACLKALKADEAYQNKKFSVVGHSWGAYACQNIPAFHPDLTHIVAISGFISVEAIIAQNFSGILKPFRKTIFELEQNTNPDYVHCHAADSLRKTDAKVLILHSADDPLVQQMYHFDIMRIVLEDKENIRFLLVNGKKHNPNYTLDAVQYKDTFFELLKSKNKKHELDDEDAQTAFRKSFDWKRMTAQDKFIWKEIFDTLDS